MDDTIVSKAYEIAKRAHAGQVDLDGTPHLCHVERVAAMLTTPEDKAAAFLHDVKEDAKMTDAELAAEGIPEKTIATVTVLTRREVEGVKEPYHEYIARIKDSGDPVALRVKPADLRHNYGRSIQGGRHSLAARYRRAAETLGFTL